MSLGKRKRDDGQRVVSRSSLVRTEDKISSSSSHSSSDTMTDQPSANESSEPDDEAQAAREALQRAFERRFAPLAEQENGLPASHDVAKTVRDKAGRNLHAKIAQATQEDVEDHWSGFDSDESVGASDSDEGQPELSNDQAAVEVINYGGSKADSDDDTYTRRHEARMFMTSKPPASKSLKPKDTGHDSDSDDPQTAQAHLKNDLALSRLIRESNLLQQPSSLSTINKGPKTKQMLGVRQATTESRLAALGAKGNIMDQRNVPRNVKMGVEGKKRLREDRRRREAKENGIVLEKATPKKSESNMRARGVDKPGVGKFKGGKLEIGKGDLKKLTSRLPMDRKGKRRR